MRISPRVFVCLWVVACSKEQPGPTGPVGPKACTEIGCVDGLRVSLEKATPWAAGNYTFAFEVDGASVTCTGALPLRGCEAGPSLRCEPDGKVQVGESGCALPPEAHGFSDVQFLEKPGPRAVGVKIIKDEQVVHEAKLTPTYATSRPNGEGCEPVCDSASETVRLP